MEQYPRLIIDTEKIRHNAEVVVENCRKHGITVAGVVKGFTALPEIARVMHEAGCSQIATSRLSQIRSLKESGIDAEYMLIRIPMLSEISEVAELADISLQSEISVLDALNEECRKKNRSHKVIIMVDLGDLREGFWDRDELLDACSHVERDLSNLKLMGIGTQLACISGIKATPENMEELVSLAEKVEERIGRKLETVSGGSTFTYSLVLDGKMPEGITHLRIGEEISLAYDLGDMWGQDRDYMCQGTAVIEAEVIEVREKPSRPVGEPFVDGFGRMPVFEDRGMMKRAIAAIGKIDITGHQNLIPLDEGVRTVAESSDHLILDVTESEREIRVGDILKFQAMYPALLGASASPDVEKVFI